MANQAPGGLTAPSSGVIVRWRIKTSGARAFDARPRVLAGAALAASGTTVPIPAAAATVTTDARLTVHTGETFGVDVSGAALGPGTGAPITNFVVLNGGSTLQTWDPPIDSGPPHSPSTDNQNELLVNADIEPDADGDGYGDETQDQCASDASTQGPCPPPPVSTGGTPGPSGGGSTGAGGSSGGAGTATTLGGALPNGPPVVTAPPPLPTPKAKKKAKRCKRAKHGHRAKRCPKKKRRSHRRR